MTASDVRTNANTLALSIPFSGTTLAVSVELAGKKLTRAHLAKVRKYLELAEEDLPVNAEIEPEAEPV